MDAVVAEGRAKGIAESVFRIPRIHLPIGGEQGAGEIAELKVRRRAVVERAYADGEKMIGDVGALFDGALPVDVLPIAEVRREPRLPDDSGTRS